MAEFYNVSQVNDHVWALKSLSGEFVYLVEGTERALLIDTCIGVGNLRSQVERITDKPVTVAITHGHIDHAMGAPEWDECWMASVDLPLYQSMCDLEGRQGYLRGNVGPEAAEPWMGTFVAPAPNYPFHLLADGQVFDLGGVTVEAIAFPGHTPGTYAMLLREDRILVTGDACNNSTFLFDEYTSSVAEYRQTVERVAERTAGRYDRIFIQHHDMEVASDLFANMLDVCDRVLARDADDLPFSFRGTQACIAMDADRRFHRTDGKSGNLIYNPEHLR